MAVEPPRPRLFAGDRVRALRARLSLSQTRLSQQLGISTSYLSQIESGDRPITGGVLAALARAFPLDWVDVAPEDESAALVAAMAAGTDPSVPAAMIDDDAVRRGVRQQLQQVIDRFVNPGLDSPVRLELLGEVPSDPAVRESVLRRQLMLDALPGTPASMALVAMAAKLTA